MIFLVKVVAPILSAILLLWAASVSFPFLIWMLIIVGLAWVAFYAGFMAYVTFMFSGNIGLTGVVSLLCLILMGVFFYNPGLIKQASEIIPHIPHVSPPNPVEILK